MSSAVSEDRFRQVFYTHLQADGYSDAEAYQFIFRTPDPFQSAPSDEHGLELLEASTKRYRAQLAHGWFLEGLSHKLEPDASVLQAPAKLVTFI
jgi:hypothetical protein